MNPKMASLAVVAILLGGCSDDSITSSSYRFRAEQDFTLTQELTGQHQFRLEGINGTITVSADPAATIVRATGTRTVESNESQEDADDRLPGLVVEITVTDDEVLLRTEQPPNTLGRNYTVDYDVVLPAGLEVEMVNVNGNVIVEDVVQALSVVNVNGNITLTRCTGEIVVGNANGNVTARSIEGDLSVTLANGNIDAEVDPRFGQVILTTANGNVRLAVPPATSATVSMILANGRITVSGLTVSDRVETTTSLTGRLGAGEGTIELRTTNGNLTLVGG